MAGTPNINDILDGHIALGLACIDRLYLNGYLPDMQVGGQVNQFCRHLGQPFGSPAVIEKIGNRFRRDLDAFAKNHDLPVLHLLKPLPMIVPATGTSAPMGDELKHIGEATR